MAFSVLLFLMQQWDALLVCMRKMWETFLFHQTEERFKEGDVQWISGMDHWLRLTTITKNFHTAVDVSDKLNQMMVER